MSVLHLVCCIAFNKLRIAQLLQLVEELTQTFSLKDIFYIFRNSSSIDIKYKYELVSHWVTMINTVTLLFRFFSQYDKLYLFIYLFIYFIYCIYLFFFLGCCFKTKIMLDSMDKLHMFLDYYLKVIYCKCLKFFSI